MPQIKPYTNIYHIKGKDYKVTADALFDDDGRLIPNKKLDDAAKEIALNMFRKDQGYVSPDEIKSFRKRLGFTQRDLANLLGMSPNTIVMYELGAIPSEANNNLLKLIINDDNGIRKVANGKNVSERVKNKVNNYLAGGVNVLDNHDLTSPFTALQLAHWFIVKNHLDHKINCNVEPITQMKLIKLLYLSYGIFLAETKNKLFKSDIKHYEWGPLVMDVHEKYIHKTVLDDEINDQAYEDYINVSANKDITNLLKFVLNKYGKYTASYLSNLTHQKNSPWSQTENHEIIDDKLIYKSFKNGNEY